jgi:hypothetical protein
MFFANSAHAYFLRAPHPGTERVGARVLSLLTTKIDIGDNGDSGSCCGARVSPPLSAGQDSGDGALGYRPTQTITLHFLSIFYKVVFQIVVAAEGSGA